MEYESKRSRQTPDSALVVVDNNKNKSVPIFDITILMSKKYLTILVEQQIKRMVMM